MDIVKLTSLHNEIMQAVHSNEQVEKAIMSEVSNIKTVVLNLQIVAARINDTEALAIEPIAKELNRVLVNIASEVNDLMKSTDIIENSLTESKKLVFSDV